MSGEKGIPLLVLDAFADRPFAGNPAAVCPLAEWLPDAVLQGMAGEHNLSETAFLVRGEAPGEFDLRWFTPGGEVDLCGHATLAAGAWLLGEHPDWPRVGFQTRSGRLEVSRGEEGGCTMDFPALDLQPAGEEAVAVVRKMAGEALVEVRTGMDTVAVLAGAEAVERFTPEAGWIRKLTTRGLAVTAAGGGPGIDFTSRFFAPALGVPEDPVTGSLHCALAPYWAARLGKIRLRGRQSSPRGGVVDCVVEGARVILAGRARLYSRGWIVGVE